jgi:hypothetical protein
MITSDRGPQFTSNLWFQLCEMLTFHTSKQQLITLSRTVQSKDAPWPQGRALCMCCRGRNIGDYHLNY